PPRHPAARSSSRTSCARRQLMGTGTACASTRAGRSSSRAWPAGTASSGRNGHPRQRPPERTGAHPRGGGGHFLPWLIVIGVVRKHRRVSGLLVIVALAAVAAVVVVPMRSNSSRSAAGKLAAVKVAPEPWTGHAKPKYQSEKSLQQLAPWDRPPPKADPPPVDPTTGMPAASAGSNGSFTPPQPSERRHVYSATHPVGGVPSALLLNRTALAPPSAPDPIRQMISAANLIVGQPYTWGGGHGSFQSTGY